MNDNLFADEMNVCRLSKLIEKKLFNEKKKNTLTYFAAPIIINPWTIIIIIIIPLFVNKH